jgi:hypothetical protein
MRWLTPFMVLCLAAGLAAQTRTFTFQDELCTYRGTYDAKSYSAAQLLNTYKLVEGHSYNLLEYNSTAFEYADIAKLDVAGFDALYKRKTSELRSLQIVPVKYFEELRQAHLREMELVYRHNRAVMLGYKDPKALLEFTEAPRECVTQWANPLIAGGDELVDAWRRVNEEARTKNLDPERLRRRFEQQMRSPDKMKFAYLEVMNFGWSNCANDAVPYVERDGTQLAQFKKLFKTVRTLRCDEP